MQRVGLCRANTSAQEATTGPRPQARPGPAILVQWHAGRPWRTCSSALPRVEPPLGHQGQAHDAVLPPRTCSSTDGVSCMSRVSSSRTDAPRPSSSAVTLHADGDSRHATPGAVPAGSAAAAGRAAAPSAALSGSDSCCVEVKRHRPYAYDTHTASGCGGDGWSQGGRRVVVVAEASEVQHGKERHKLARRTRTCGGGCPPPSLLPPPPPARPPSMRHTLNHAVGSTGCPPSTCAHPMLTPHADTRKAHPRDPRAACPPPPPAAAAAAPAACPAAPATAAGAAPRSRSSPGRRPGPAAAPDTWWWGGWWG